MKKLTPTNLELMQTLALIFCSDIVNIGSKEANNLIELGLVKKHFEEHLALTLPGIKLIVAIRKSMTMSGLMKQHPSSEKEEEVLGKILKGNAGIDEMLEIIHQVKY